MGTHPIFESDFDCLTELSYLATWKQDCTRKTHLCPHTGMMIIKDFRKFPDDQIRGRSHANQRNRDWSNWHKSLECDEVTEKSWKNSQNGPILNETTLETLEKPKPTTTTAIHTTVAMKKSVFNNPEFAA